MCGVCFFLLQILHRDRLETVSQRYQPIISTDHAAGADADAGKLFQNVKIFQVPGAWVSMTLDLQRIERAALLDDQIDFFLILIPVKIQRRFLDTPPTSLRSSAPPAYSSG